MKWYKMHLNAQLSLNVYLGPLKYLGKAQNKNKIGL